MPSQVFTTTGTQTWNWPAGVTSVVAEALGAGGGSGTASGNPSTGGGGKGGSYAKATITKGAETLLTVVVGAGGAVAGAGAASTVVQGGTTVVSAAGGGGGASQASASANGAGGTTLNGANTGTTTFAGGNGGTGNFTSGTQGSGAGGGAAGPTSIGGAASVNVAGTVGTGTFGDGVVYQAAGAAGVGNSTAGSTGPAYGGGASGGKCNSGVSKSGATGGNGRVVFVWTAPAQAVTALNLTSTLALNVPTVVAVGPLQSVTGTTLTSGSQTFAPTVAFALSEVVLDTFNRPDENPVAGGWAKFLSYQGLAVVGNQLATPSNVSCASYWTNPLPADFFVFASVAALQGTPSFSANEVRIGAYTDVNTQTLPHGFHLTFSKSSDGTVTLGLIRANAGSFTTLASTPNYTFVAGEVYALERQGTTIRVWRKSSGTWTKLHEVTDTNFPGAVYGIVHVHNYDDPSLLARVDDFGTRGTLVVGATVASTAVLNVPTVATVSAGGPLVFINETHVMPSASGVATFTCPAISHTTGNALIVCYRGGPGKTFSSLSDTAGNTFNYLGSVQDVAAGGGGEYYFWEAHNIIGHASNVVQAVLTTSDGYGTLVVHQVSGFGSGTPSHTKVGGGPLVSTGGADCPTSNLTFSGAEAYFLGVWFVGYETGTHGSHTGVVVDAIYGNASGDAFAYVKVAHHIVATSPHACGVNINAISYSSYYYGAICIEPATGPPADKAVTGTTIASGVQVFAPSAARVGDVFGASIVSTASLRVLSVFPSAPPAGGWNPVPLLKYAFGSFAGGAGGVTTSFDTRFCNFLVLHIAYSKTNNFDPAPTVADNQGNFWVGTVGSAETTVVRSTIYYCVNPITSASHTLTITGYDGNTYPSVEVTGWVGGPSLHPTTIVDAGQTGSHAPSSTTLQLPSLTPEGPGHLIITGIGHGDNAQAALTVDQGFTVQVDWPWYVSTFGRGGAQASLVQGATAAVAPTWNLTTATPAAATIAAFKINSGAVWGDTVATSLQMFAPTVANAGAGPQAVTGVTLTTTATLTAPTPITTGPVTVLGATRASALAVNVPSVTTGPVTITGVTVAATSQGFIPSVAVGPVTILGVTRATTIQVFAPVVALTVLGATISTGSGTFAPAVALTILAPTRATTAAVFVPTVGLGLTAATLAPTAVLNVPVVALAGVLSVSGVTLASSAVLSPASVTAGPVTVTGVHRATTITMNAPVVALTATGATISSGSGTFTPSVALTVTGATRAAASVVNVPSVVVGPVSISGVTLASAAQLFLPSVSAGGTAITGASQPSTLATFAPSVALTVTTATRATTSVLFAATLALTVTTSTLTSATQLFPAVVLPEGGLGGATVPTTRVLFAPTVAAGAVPVTGTRIVNAPSLFVPSVLPITAVTGAPCASTSQVFAAAVSAGPATVVGVTCASVAQTFAPTLVGRLDGAFRASTAVLFPPTVLALSGVVGATLPSGSVVQGPGVTTLAFVTGATRLSAAQVFAAAVAPVIGAPTRLSTAVLFGPSVVPVMGVIVVGNLPSGVRLFGPSVGKVLVDMPPEVHDFGVAIATRAETTVAVATEVSGTVAIVSEITIHTATVGLVRAVETSAAIVTAIRLTAETRPMVTVER